MKNATYLPEGRLIGTKENERRTSDLRLLECAVTEGTILEGMAVSCTDKSCLNVSLGNGLRATMPRCEVAWDVSGTGIRDIALISRVGKAVCFKVTSVVVPPSGEPIITVSRREAQKECYECRLSFLRPGDVIESKVTHLEHFGAFVDIGCGIVSLLGIDCISVSRISHPRDRFKTGEYVDVVVKSIDRESGRIYVSRKELLGSWEENAALFSPGDTVAGTVRSVEDYGVFVELTPNLAGLAEYRPDVSVGQVCAVYVKSIIPERMKVKLALIDSYPGEKVPSPALAGRVFRPGDHMGYWRYSPAACGKVIETFFD